MPKEMRIPNTAIRIISYTLIPLPAVLSFVYVYSFGVNVPFGDMWRIVPLFDQLSSGALSVPDIYRWSQHYQHRLFFPGLVILLLGAVTKFNLVAVMYLIQACYVGMLAALLLAFTGTIKSKLYLFIPIAFLVFSPGQYWDMLQPFSINLVFAQVFAVFTFYLLYVLGYGTFKRLAFVGALGSATVAAFSAANGLLVWPVGVLQLFITPVERATKKLLIAAWSLVGLGEWTLYLLTRGWDHNTPVRQQPLLYVLEHPVAGADHFLMLLGNSLFRYQGLDTVSGLLLISLAAVGLLLIYKDRTWGEYSFWLILLLFSCLTLAAITAGRSSIEEAFYSRYTVFSIPAAISVYVIFVKLAFARRSKIIVGLCGVLVVFVLASIPVSYAEGIRAGSRVEVNRSKEAFIISTYESQPPKLLEKIPHVGGDTTLLSTLQRLDYSVFSEQEQILPPRLSALSPVSGRTFFVVETIADVEVNPQDQPVVVPGRKPFIKITGWAVDERAKDVAGGVYVDVDGKLFPAFYGQRKAGVARRFDVPAYERSGFERAIPTSEIGQGTHTLSIVVLTSDKKGYYRPDRQVIFEVR